MVIDNIVMVIVLMLWDGKHMVMILDRDGNNGGVMHAGDGVDIGVWCIHRSVTCKKVGSRSKAGRCVHHGLLPTTEETPL